MRIVIARFVFTIRAPKVQIIKRYQEMPNYRPDDQRVVITGVGAMTPLALTMTETWEGLLAGRSGIGPITQFDASSMLTTHCRRDQGL